MGLTGTEISGVLLCALKPIPTATGMVLKMLSPQSALLPDFSRNFGEIYFSVLHEGKINAWKRHRLQTQCFAVPQGLIKIALFDARPNSSTRNKLVELKLGLPANYALLKIPPGIWYGFANLGKGSAVICNCADIPHDPGEGERLDADSALIPYKW